MDDDSLNPLNMASVEELTEELKSRFDVMAIRAVKLNTADGKVDRYEISEFNDFKGPPYALRGVVDELKDMIEFLSRNHLFDLNNE